MRVVQKPLPFTPYVCCVTGRDDGDIIDFEIDVPCSEPPHVYMKKEALEQVAVELGMVKAEDVEEVRSMAAKVSEEAEELRGLLKAYEDLEKRTEQVRERSAA